MDGKNSTVCENTYVKGELFSVSESGTYPKQKYNPREPNAHADCPPQYIKGISYDGKAEWYEVKSVVRDHRSTFEILKMPYVGKVRDTTNMGQDKADPRKVDVFDRDSKVFETNLPAFASKGQEFRRCEYVFDDYRNWVGLVGRAYKVDHSGKEVQKSRRRMESPEQCPQYFVQMVSDDGKTKERYEIFFVRPLDKDGQEREQIEMFFVKGDIPDNSWCMSSHEDLHICVPS